MELKFRVFGRIARPVSEVFEAVADPAQLSRYFTTGGAIGRLEKGATVTWDFADFPGAFPVNVIDLAENSLITLRWGSNEGGRNTTDVTMQFSDGGHGVTLLEITESGWPENQAGLNASYGNCMGWSQMLCAMKMWVEHRIRMRDGFYK